MNKSTFCVTKRIFSYILVFILALWFVSGMFIPAFAARSVVALRPVKVGYAYSDGYFEVDSSGVRSGYGFEYLMYMSRYTNWQYEFVDIGNDYNKAVEMVKNGELDMITGLPYNEDYISFAKFSAESIGVSKTILTAPRNSQKLVAGNVLSFDGARIGMLINSNKEKCLEEYAKKHSFSYDVIYYTTFDAMYRAMQAGDIDCMVSNSVRGLKNEWVFANLDEKPLHVLVSDSAMGLIDEVNFALDSVKNDYPEIQGVLQDKYFTDEYAGSLMLSLAETQYLENLRASDSKLTAVVNPDRAPLSYFDENKKPCGILAEIEMKLEEVLALDIEIIYTENREQYLEIINAGYPTLVLDAPNDYNMEQNTHYRLTDSYIRMGISLVTRKDLSGDIKKLAVVKDASMLQEHEETFLSGREILYYKTHDECIEAVLSGEVDGYYCISYCGQRSVNSDRRHRLVLNHVSDFMYEYSIGILDKEDYNLVSVIDKALESISGPYIDNLAIKYNAVTQSSNIMDYMYDNPEVFAVVAFLVCAFVAMIIGLIIKIKNEKIINRNASELRRFITYVCNANASVAEVNLSTMKILWYTVDEENELVKTESDVVWDNFDENIHPDDFAQLTQKFDTVAARQLVASGGEFYFEARSKDSHGQYKWASFLLQGVEPDQYHPENFIMFKKDIDDVKRADELYKSTLRDALETARNASQAKGMFMSKMSHEIRTPLNAVLGYLSMAKDSRETKKKDEYISKCETAAKHLLGILNDVLDIASIESGKMKIAHEKFDIKELVTGIQTLFYSQAQAKGVELSVKVNNIYATTLIGDQLRVNQILINLVSNAIKFTPQGGKVMLCADQLTEQDGKVNFRFTVSDTGKGMSEEFIKKAFVPFEQESAGIAKNYGGTGLGLSITRNLVDLMHGVIDVTSKQGVGTTFTVHLAFDYVQTEEQKVKNGDLSAIRALVVLKNADDPEIALMFKRMGVKHTVVESGEEAVNQLKRRMNTVYEYNFVLIDWFDEESFKIAEQIRFDLSCQMPIAVICPLDISSVIDTAQKSGVDKLISMPVFQSAIFDLLVDSFGKYKIPQSDESYNVEGLRILLVEDNQMNLEIASDMLTKRGVIVECAENGEIAVEKFTNSPDGYYNAILMDVSMPVMDGYEATRRIRALERGYAKFIPIIAMTASAFTEDISEALLNGMDDHVSKPIDYDKLFLVLSRLGNLSKMGRNDN